jgi:hypothetical protein
MCFVDQQPRRDLAQRILVDWIHFYSDTSHPLSRRTIHKKGKRPSAGWIRHFLARWPEIKLGKPSGLDPKRSIDLLLDDASSNLTCLFRNTTYKRRTYSTWTRKAVNEEEARKHHHESILFLEHVVQSINSAVPISNSLQSLSVSVQMEQILNRDSSFRGKNSPRSTF